MKFILLLVFMLMVWTGLEMAFRLGRIRGQLDRADRPCSDPAPRDGWSR